MSTLGWMALCISTVIDLALLLGVLYGRRGRVDHKRAMLAIAAAVVVGGVKLIALVAFAHSMFFAINLAYTALVVTAPVAGVVVWLAARRRETSRSTLVIAACAWVPAPIGFYATFVEPFRLVEERVSVPLAAERRLNTELRIAVLADLQSREVDEHLHRAIASAMAFEPHLILLPGDLIQRGAHEYDAAVPQFRALLKPLDAPLGVYFVLGNTDDAERVGRVFEGTSVRLLDNETVELAFDGRRVLLGGCGFNPFDVRTSTFVHQFENLDGDDVRLLVAHYPDVVHDLGRPSRVDLLIAGHTHGGQVQVPWYGPPLTLSSVPRHIAAGGLHEWQGRRIYVSRGIGCERGLAPRVRFLAPPEVSLLTLR